MNPQLLLVAALAFALATGGAYIKGRGDGAAIVKADQAEILEVVRNSRAEAQLGAADAIAAITVQHTTIRQTLEKEIHEKTVYRDCQHPPDQLQRINATLTGREPVTASGGVVPRLDATR